MKFATCGECGALVAITGSVGEGPDNRKMHERWHARLSERFAALGEVQVHPRRPDDRG